MSLGREELAGFCCPSLGLVVAGVLRAFNVSCWLMEKLVERWQSALCPFLQACSGKFFILMGCGANFTLCLSRWVQAVVIYTDTGDNTPPISRILKACLGVIDAKATIEESLLYCVLDSSCLVFVVETEDKVIGIAGINCFNAEPFHEADDEFVIFKESDGRNEGAGRQSLLW